MDKFPKDTPAEKVKVLPIYYASPIDRARLVKSDRERLALFNHPDILAFFLCLRSEISAVRISVPKRPRHGR